MREFYWTIKMIPSIRNRKTHSGQEVFFMKGYYTASGYMGYVGDGYILFASEEDYLEYMAA